MGKTAETKRVANTKHIEIILVDLLIVLTGYAVFTNYKNSGFAIVFMSVALILNTSRIWFSNLLNRIFDFIIKYRYLISFIIFAVLVAFRINGSSIGVYDELLGKTDESITSELFGAGRMIRSDEWNVQVPYFFSQLYNSYGLNSDFMSLSPQNMIIGYNAPVIDLTLIGKPFIWGYILFGNDVGLSWYWCSKIILYILVAFEMFKIITGNDYLSAFASIALVFSPVLQWWLAPHMYQVFFWSSLLFVVGYYFFLAKKTWQKVLFTVLAICSLTGFVVAIFPSLQVALGLLMLSLLIAKLIIERKNIRWDKSIFIQLCVVIIITGIVIGNFLLSSKEAISLLNNTVYPGHRVSTGGNYGFNVLFTNPSVGLTPFYSPANSNECEISSFNQLGVFCILTFPVLLYARRKSKIKESFIFGYFLIGAIMTEAVFMLIGFPEMIARITLFSYINRMDMVYGFTALLFTIWTINEILIYKSQLSWKTGLLLAIVFTILYILTVDTYVDPGYRGIVGRKFYYLIAVLFGTMGYLLFTKWRNMFFSIFACWIFITGMLVNPIVVGAESISNHDLVIASKQIAQIEPDAKWITIGSTTTQELLLANGIKVLNAVNFYPDLQKWKIIDPNEDFMDIYNRYAHILVYLTNGSTHMQLISPDAIRVDLDVRKLKELGIRYLVCGEPELSMLSEAGINTEQIYYDKHINQSIYELSY